MLSYLQLLDEQACRHGRAWQVSFDGASVGGVELSLQANEAMLDTGTSAIVMSDFDALAINGVLALI